MPGLPRSVVYTAIVCRMGIDSSTEHGTEETAAMPQGMLLIMLCSQGMGTAGGGLLASAC